MAIQSQQVIYAQVEMIPQRGCIASFKIAILDDNSGLFGLCAGYDANKSEIIADYMGNVAGEIYERKKRMPTIEEIKEMSREAFLYAEKVLK